MLKESAKIFAKTSQNLKKEPNAEKVYDGSVTELDENV